MCKDKLITGIKVTEQMRRAKKILIEEVIPREQTFQARKKQGKLSPELMAAIKSNA